MKTLFKIFIYPFKLIGKLLFLFLKFIYKTLLKFLSPLIKSLDRTLNSLIDKFIVEKLLKKLQKNRRPPKTKRLIELWKKTKGAKFSSI